MGWWIGGLVDWWMGWIGGVVWAGGLVEWRLVAWGSEVREVILDTRDRDGSADF